MELWFVRNVRRGPAELQRTLEIIGAILQVRKQAQTTRTNCQPSYPSYVTVSWISEEGCLLYTYQPNSSHVLRAFHLPQRLLAHLLPDGRNRCKLGFLLLQHTAALACQVQLVMCPPVPSPTPTTPKASWVK